MTERTSQKLSDSFWPRESPASFLASKSHTIRSLEGVSPQEYETYLTCRSPDSPRSAVRDYAERVGRSRSTIDKLCTRVEFKLDQAILRQYPDWARSLVPFALDLKLYQGKTKRSQAYFQMLIDWLPHLALDEPLKSELLAFCHLHYGGVMVHCDRPTTAIIAYGSAAKLFTQLLRLKNIGVETKALWKNHALAAIAERAGAEDLANRSAEGLRSLEAEVAALRELDRQARKPSRDFDYPGHRFIGSIGHLQRVRGTILTRLGQATLALDAFNETARIAEDYCVADPNTRAAALLRRARAFAARREMELALADLTAAEASIDPHKETGVYSALINKEFAFTYRAYGDEAMAIQHAEKARDAANRVGLERQQNHLEDFFRRG